MTASVNSSTTTMSHQSPEEAAKQFIMNTLDLEELPSGSLQEILYDGTLLCDLIKRFSPTECPIKNEGRTKFAYQDNIGQFLRAAESLHIPQSELFQTVDLLEGKRMQSVISCLLAIKRIMSERKILPIKSGTNSTSSGKISTARNSYASRSPSPITNSMLQQLSSKQDLAKGISNVKATLAPSSKLLPLPSIPKHTPEETKINRKRFSFTSVDGRELILEAKGSATNKPKTVAQATGTEKLVTQPTKPVSRVKEFEHSEPINKGMHQFASYATKKKPLASDLKYGWENKRSNTCPTDMLQLEGVTTTTNKTSRTYNVDAECFGVVANAPNISANSPKYRSEARPSLLTPTRRMLQTEDITNKESKLMLSQKSQVSKKIDLTNEWPKNLHNTTSRGSSSNTAMRSTEHFKYSTKTATANKARLPSHSHNHQTKQHSNYAQVIGTKPQDNVRGYVKSQVQMISTNNLTVVEPNIDKIRRLSSSEENLVTYSSPVQDIDMVPSIDSPMELLPLPAPQSSRSTPSSTTAEPSKSKSVSDLPERTSSHTTENRIQRQKAMDCANRKASLKKMGACAITVQNDDGSSAVYALGKSIGRGQFGEVFGGLNMDTGEYVAIKRLKRSKMDCDDMKEVDVLKHLDSEHIVRYKGYSKDNEYLNIILEYVEMGSLYNNIKAFGKFPEKLAASYTYKILSGLRYLHSKDVIHCDLKAANILTTKSGGLKLTDFGVSLSLKMKDEDTGEPAGTPNWMAPEVIKFAGASAKSDIWSLGCTIVEMLTGKPPYAGIPSFAALYRIVEDEEPPLPQNIQLSEDATGFLLACFRKNPSERPSAEELMKFKWMRPYYEQEQQTLLTTAEHNQAITRSKSDTYLELSNEQQRSEVASSSITLSGNHSLSHRFIDYQTYQKGEKCCGCLIQMKRLWVKNCQDCQMKFHPHCVNKAPPCTKGYHIPSAIIKPTNAITGDKRAKPRYAPLGPLNPSNKKGYLQSSQSQSQQSSSPPRYPHYQYKPDGYTRSKSDSNTQRHFISSIMT